ncbi:methylmalonyl-CoA mutase family protein [Mongoliitalea daihaiensis]|uniref:methylmalonyl-CoA mutase family protein n=1 Tax=Mongoliitalea daihaiensis TaxID=2782006 RepID=UPI001F3D6968|nr:methylmalonyl-CoA mutase family protein [Mongoliitalea daihaiensis]UJP64982.1 hypothetical protein IPZ59_19750 [Mongoliitalea daihaiensis]
MNQKLFEVFPKTSKEEWVTQVVKDLKGKDFEQALVSKTSAGLQVNPFFTDEDTQHLDVIKSYRNLINPISEIPGLDPRLWSNVHHVVITDEVSANKGILYALSNGADAIRVELKGGEDYSQLLKDVHLQYIQVFLDPQGDPTKIMQEFVQYLEEIQFPADQLHGAFMWGGLVYALRFKNSKSELVEDAYQLLELSQKYTYFKVVGIVGTYYHNAGATSVQEMGYAFGSWMGLAERLSQKGVSIASLAKKTFIGTAVGSDFFEEIAKVKVYRIFFHQLLSLYGVDYNAEEIFVYASTSQWTKTQKDVHTNMIRNTYEAMAAIIGGCNALHVLPFDQAVKDADRFSLRMSRNISSILQQESYLSKILDPTAGSYYIENLMLQLLEATKDKLSVIEQEGGWWHLYASLQMQEEIKLTRQERQQAVADGKTILVGVNKYPNKEDTSLSPIVVEEANWQVLPSRLSLLSEQ